MRRSDRVGVLAVALLGCGLAAATVSAADRPDWRKGDGHDSPPFTIVRPGQQPVIPQPRQHPAYDPRHGGRVPAVAVAPPVILYPPYPGGYAEPAPDMTYAAPAPPPPAVAPMPSVIEYPTGRYELRGNGMTAPYMWVWVPYPPPGPPMAPPPPPPPPALPPQTMAAPPPPVPQTVAAPAPPAAPAPRMELYRWTDESGVTTWTDRLDKVPERYRTQASPR